jgi:stage V sporulation protein SpoVS
MECPIQPDRQNQGERIHRGMDLHGNYAFVDIQVDSISDSAEYIGKECPIQPDRQNQGEGIHRGMDLHISYAFVDIQVDSISELANTLAWSGPYSQTDETREKEFPEGWSFAAITPS